MAEVHDSRSAVIRYGLLAVLLVLTVCWPARAQDRPAAVADVEDHVRRRVEAWYRERAPRRVACSRCRGAGDRRPDCYMCDRTGLDLSKVARKVLVKFMRPSERRGLDLEHWFRESMRQQPTWGLFPFAIEDVKVESVLVGRDTAWATVAWKENRACEAWAREGREFWTGYARDGAPDLIAHEWFVAGTFSVPRIGDYLEALVWAEEREGLTDLERARAREAREAAEQEARTRVVADRGEILNVSREVTAEGDVSYDVSIWTGSTDVHVRVVPGPRHGESARALEDRLAGMPQWTTVVFRGRLQSWARTPGALPSRVDLVDGQVHAHDGQPRPLPVPGGTRPPDEDGDAPPLDD